LDKIADKILEQADYDPKTVKNKENPTFLDEVINLCIPVFT
jgi:hypothetical protein